MVFRYNLNPFDTIPFELTTGIGYTGKQYLHSRTLQPSLREKIEDTFNVLLGTTVRFGLFDYATLGIFLVVHELADFLGAFLWNNVLDKKPKNGAFKKLAIYTAKVLAFIPCVVVVPIDLIGNFPIRFVVSTLLTALFIPIFILPAHGIVKLVSSFKINQVEVSSAKNDNTYVKLKDRLANNTPPIVLNKDTELTIEKDSEGNPTIVYDKNGKKLSFYPKHPSTIEKLIETNKAARASIGLTNSRTR